MPGQLVLVRHGQSQWNLENRFTGWVDVPLSPLGIEEAQKAGVSLRALSFTHAFTSELKRAQNTLQSILTEVKQTSLSVVKHVALNERHYGALQGLDKGETAAKYGAEQVHIWRRSYDVPPPKERTEFNPEGISESLKDTAARTLPYFNSTILPLVKAGGTVLVAAHGNSLRAIVMDLDGLTKGQVLELNIATAAPILYVIDSEGKILKKSQTL